MFETSIERERKRGKESVGEKNAKE